MRAFATIICWTLLSFNVHAQFDFSGYLGSVTDDLEVSLLEEQMDFMETENFNLPILRGVEVRMRTSDMDEAVEDYRFRLEFMNPFERSANKAYNQSFQSKLEIEQEVLFGDVLLLRYQLLIRHFEIQSDLDRLSADIELLRSLMALAEKKGDAAKSLKSNLETTKLQLKQTDLETEMDLLNTRIRGVYGGSQIPNWEGFGMVSQETMTMSLNLMDSTAIPVLRLLDQKTDLAEKEYKLEKANSRRAIGFIQSEYDWDRGNWPREHWGFQVGISIPIVNADRPDLQYEKLDMIELSSETQMDIEAYNRRLHELTRRFYTTRNGLELVNEKLSQAEINPNTENQDEQLSLELFQYRRDLQELKSDYHIKLLKAYLQIIHLRGGLNPLNRVNYLSNSFSGY